MGREAAAPRDVGTLTLPGAFLDALSESDWGRGECGLSELIRYHESQAGAVGARVQLRAESTAQFFFHPGLVGL